MTVRLADGTVARGRRPGREDGGRLRPAQALHRRAGPAGRDPRADPAPAPAARRDRAPSSPPRPTRSCSSRSRPPASSTPGRPSACWCGSRARSPARWPSRPPSWSAASSVEDDEELWAEHRELAAGLELTRCLPADVPDTIAQLRAAGATTIVGRYARGLLYADVNIECLAPDIHRVGARAAGGGGVRWLRRSTCSMRASTAASACRRARPTRCGATRWTRPAAAST